MNNQDSFDADLSYKSEFSKGIAKHVAFSKQSRHLETEDTVSYM